MPSTVRVSDLAKEVQMEPGELLRVLQTDFSLRVRTVSSSIRDGDARKVRNRLRLQQRRASRPDRRVQAEANIRRAAEQRLVREAAEAKARGEAERKAREEAERKAQEEAEAKVRAEEEEAERLSAEKAASERRAEEERRAAELEAQRAVQEQAAAAARELAEREAEKKAPVPTAPKAAAPKAAAPKAPDGESPVGESEARAGTAAAPVRPERMAAASEKPEETTAPAPRRIETRSIASTASPAGFRPGATDRKIVPAVTRPRPVRRATPPRIRATPPPLRRSPSAPPKPQRPAPGRRSKGRRRQAPAETPEVLEGVDSPLPPGLRQAVTREYRTNAKVALNDGITVKGLAEAMSIPTVEVIKALLLQHGVAASINQPLDTEIATKLVLNYGGSIVKPGAEPSEQKKKTPVKAEEKQEDLVERAPVVTVMGHVDHGKTSLLDAIRSARVVDSEAGGITQHMSAYTVETNGHRLVFLDTPGHEAFTKMRARGAGVTDVVILVVAADDGVKEQTIEALNHARAAGVPIVVAVNKMDKPAADPDLVMRQLAEREVTPEEWGGDSIFSRVSAKTQDGLPELLQSVLDVAELEEPTANPQGPARGVVLEARKDKGRGPVAQFLVQEGTLAVGDTVSAGAAWGKVRALLDEAGRRMKKALPSTPCEVLGLTEVPVVGDQFSVSRTPAEARRTAEEKKEETRLQLIEGRQRLNLQNLHVQMSGGLKELSIVVKADVGGTVEAVRDALERLSSDEVKVRVIHAAAGAVSESDVNLASATESIIVAFGVRPDPQAQRLAEQEKVEIRGHTVIYHLVEEMEKALAGLLEPETEIVELGKIEVRRTFQVPRVGVVAGSYVLAGSVPRNARVRLVRDGRLVYTGRIGSLRRFKEDVAQVREGFECGVGIAGYNDVKIGDVIEAFREEQVSPVAD